MIFKHHPLKDVIQTLSTRNSDLTVAVTGDIHLHHPRVPTRRIIQHLDTMFGNEVMKYLDVVVLNGDVMDRRLSMEAEDFTDIFDWMGRFLRTAKRHAVRVVIVEGTRSHDHRQSQLFQFINNLAFIDADLHYHDELTIVELYPGYTALLVPDEVNHDASVTAGQVQDLLNLRGLEQVDFSFMHGMFRYQAPIETPVSHNETFYTKITKQRVVINHIHTPSSNGIIRAPGSPVRLKHGEEEDKGFYIVSIKGDEVFEWFVETEGNVNWITVDVTGLDLPQVYEILDGYDKTLADGDNLRLRMTRNCPSKASLRVIKHRYGRLKFTEDFVDGKQGTLGNGDEIINHHAVRLSLTSDVIINKLKERLQPVLQDDPQLITVLDTLLHEGATS